jgi:uncharacterized membrane protein YdfJ with MMPL/SSD domain
MLVPALMSLMGGWNWLMPKWTSRVLRVERPRAPGEIAAESI